MSETDNGKLGIARIFALVFGTAYLVLAFAEILFQHQIAGAIGIQFSPTHNAIHLVFGVVIFVAGFGSERTAGAVDIVIGVIFLIMAVAGFVWTRQFGDLVGLHGSVPSVYNIVHAVTAAVALFAGFAGRSRSQSGSPSTY